MHGIGHFTFAFVLTYACVLVAWRSSPSIGLRLYGPFLPFVVGGLACVPYALQSCGLLSADAAHEAGWNVFILSAALDSSAVARRVLGVFELDVLLLSLAYIHMLHRYIVLVRGAGDDMPNKHFYVAMGVATGAVAAVVLSRHRPAVSQRLRRSRLLWRFHRDWFLYFPALYVPFVLWALVPDILHGTALVAKDVTRGPAFDVFYLHSSFERWEDLYPTLDHVLNTIGSLTLLLAALGTNLFYVREYRRRTTPGR